MAAIEEEDDVPMDCISPNGDVFSYFMLTSPSELKKHSRFTTDAIMSYMLVSLFFSYKVCCCSVFPIRSLTKISAGRMEL